ncbi:MAG: UDP-N-acetylmuramoyl-L-alanyl-D-glutamate--2,6-diaminopimelate ligase [Porticoccaceae bacterium]|nr:MAG: UDP-N-acetylmuramoyl-L-alanyl-D-glutamate--2,6-diaminopimelate ligase [Porticoccaceae bacterium]
MRAPAEGVALAALFPEGAAGLQARRVTGLALDSRRVRPGDLFLAVPGTRSDGRRHIPEALARGAAAVAAEAEGLAQIWPAGSLEARCREAGAAWLAVPGLARRLGEVAAAFYGHPARRLRVFAVTGTDGKTTCALLAARLAARLGEPAGVVGTLGWGMVGSEGEQLAETGMTTPDAVTLQALFAELVERGVRFVALEASSHGLHQHRLDACEVAVGVFTNLGRDHLDYHGDLEAYAAAKRRLFTFPSLQVAAINVDDPVGLEILGGLPAGVVGVGYGRGPAAAVRATAVRSSVRGLEIALRTPWGEAAFTSRLLGEFNALNLLALIAAFGALGHPLAEIASGLEALPPVPGRMERFGGSRGPQVVVDYAHTPRALSAALAALRPHCPGRLWVVFGCGGERDPGKRPLMGAAAEIGADRVVVTSDNPRGEDPAAIAAAILAGMADPAAAVVELDRAAAIRRAVAEAQEGDWILVAGKGHEAWQEVAGRRLPLCDRELVRAALAAREAAS